MKIKVAPSLLSADFSCLREEIKKVEILAVNLSNKTRIAKTLKHGPMTVDQIVEETGISKGVVKNELSRSKDTFINTPKGWGVLAQQEFNEDL